MGVTQMVVDKLSDFMYVLPFLIVESSVRLVTTRIQNGALKSSFYWSMFCLSRFAYYDLTSASLNGFQTNGWTWTDFLQLSSIISTPLLCHITFRLLVHVFPFHMLEQSNDQRIHINQTRLWWRHCHPPIDTISFYYNLFKIDRSNYKISRFHITVLDNNRIYDPAWPNCSMVHSIMVFMCKCCSKDNGLHILRTSIYRRQTRSIWSHQFPQITYDKIDQLQINAFESNGLILISMVHDGGGHDLLIFDLLSGKMISLDLKSLFPNPSFLLCYAIHDDGSELGDQKNLSSIYLRLLYYEKDPSWYTCYGQSLIEVHLINGAGGPEKLLWEEHIWPPPWNVPEHEFFPMSLDRVGIRATFHHPVHGERMESMIWDPSRKKLMADDSCEDLINNDLPLRLHTERCPEDTVPNMVLLNEMEAIALKHDWSIWHTSFQPPSLKSLCLGKIFGTKKLDKFSSHDWLEMTGVDVHAYFEGKKT